jgi:dienelactone hydrolase
LQNFASADDAVQALIEVGQQQPGVKKGAIGVFGVSASGPEALQLTTTRTDIGAVVVDSSLRGPPRVSAPVLILGGTADPVVSVQSQQEYEQSLRDSGTTVEAH